MSEGKAEYVTETKANGALSPSGSETADEPRQLLTRQQLAAVLGVNDAKIRRYAEIDSANVYFGGIPGLGKGVRYPAEAIPLFREALTLTPAVLQKRITEAMASGQVAVTGALSLSAPGSLLTAADSERLIETIRAGLSQSIELPPVQIVAYAYTDRLLTMKEAREETGLTIAEIKALPSVQTSERGRRRWKRSELQKRIASF